MMFTAHYIPLQADTTANRLDYYLTVDGDSQRDAWELAKRYARKGYRLVTLVERIGACA